jgi:1-acyl-sn-glycerol-3-phosphate acyltransferase
MSRLHSFPNPALQHRRWPEGVPHPNRYYRFMRFLCWITFYFAWRIRVFNRHREPTAGSVLYISNHQSFLDPMLIGMALQRPVNYMARDSLFKIPGFSRLIRSINAFPVRRGTADLAAMKEALRRLKAGGQVAVFAEGTRTRDGRVGPLLPGVAMLAQRGADWTVPVVIDGAYESWPRKYKLPHVGDHIVVEYGRPISRAEAAALPGEQLLGKVRQEIIDMQTDLRRRIGRPPLAY